MPHFSQHDEAAVDDPHERTAAARTAGRDFARAWFARVEHPEVEAVLRTFPRVPHDVNTELMVYGEEALGCSLRYHPDLKSELRATFWFELKTLAAAPGVDSGDGGEAA
jgi:hypothetical protein